jgi:type 1 glutamine amidotransferase
MLFALLSPMCTSNANAAEGAPPPGYRDVYANSKRVLIVGDVRTGNQNAHSAIGHAMAVLEQLGRREHDYISFLRSDTELVTKDEVWGKGDYAKGGPKQARGRNLDYFDAVVFYTNGETDMTPQQKKDLLAFVHDDGKGFIAIHTATATGLTWPEYGEMVGAYFDNHPWGIFAAPVRVERPESSIVGHLPHEFTMTDEMYQYREPYRRDQVDVLISMDPGKLDLANKNVHRTDRDFPLAWTRLYGKGRVFSSSLGHSDASWDDPWVQTMYLQAIRWALRLSDDKVRPHPLP